MIVYVYLDKFLVDSDPNTVQRLVRQNHSNEGVGYPKQITIRTGIIIGSCRLIYNSILTTPVQNRLICVAISIGLYYVT